MGGGIMGVEVIVARASSLATLLGRLVLPHYKLAVTTVTGIPMKVGTFHELFCTCCMCVCTCDIIYPTALWNSVVYSSGFQNRISSSKDCSYKYKFK